MRYVKFYITYNFIYNTFYDFNYNVLVYTLAYLPVVRVCTAQSREAL